MKFSLKVSSYSASSEDIGIICECIEEALGFYGFRAGLVYEWAKNAKPGDTYNNFGIRVEAKE